jgi:tetratricopeptide (TPR) repeat protein
MDLMSDGDHEEARHLLERYVKDLPADPEGHASLGVCLLKVDDFQRARDHLLLAVKAEPKNAIYLWNLAAAAHKVGDEEECYQVLCRYLELGDLEDATSERESLARDFVEEHTRLTLGRGYVEPVSKPLS